MVKAHAPSGKENTVRVIVFCEADQYVAQCLEYDIATQAKSIEAVIDRMELTLDAEFAHCAEADVEAHTAIAPAPNYYHELWESRYASLERIKLPKPDGAPQVQVALAKVA